MHTLAGLLLVLPALAAPPSGGKVELAPQAGVVILKNGHTIAGKITRAGDYVVVTQGESSELRLPAADVEFVSRDLDEAYARKAAALPKDQVGPHLDLAEWCLRHDMPAQATERWVAAYRIDPQHRRVGAVEQRLRLYAQRPTSAAVPTGETAALSPEELDKFTRDLPKSTVEKFAATVQPILLNRCANGGCHGPSGTSEFKLFRPAFGQVANRRFTQRNLYAALQQIDRSNPERSALLTKPFERHGGAGQPIFDKQSQTQFEQLAAWVRQATIEPTTAQPATIRSGAQSLSQPARIAPTSAPEPEPESAPETKPRANDEKQAPEHAAGGAKPKLPAPGFTPRDPFDAEQFNRLYHPQP
jgi:hypothetical protein